MKHPLISVITVTYNTAGAVEETINSIIQQPSDDFEYIIVDGGSKDGTVDVIARYSDKITKWISEPDKGIPDALNKGIAMARGKYIVFILAGDRLMKLPVEQLAGEDADVVCFPVLVTGNVVHYPEVNNWLKIKNTIPHQGAFFKRTENLVHDLRYRFYCDLALCQVYYKAGLQIKIYEEPVVAFHGLDGATSNKRNFREVFRIVKDNYGIFYQVACFLYWKQDGLLKRLGFRK